MSGKSTQIMLANSLNEKYIFFSMSYLVPQAIPYL